MARMQAVPAGCWMMLAAQAGTEDALTPLERRWLAFAQPVLAESRVRRLPLDVVVQPQPNDGEPAVAMAFDSARCKLVLTMRGSGNPSAPDVDADLARPFVEAMFAHELAHCWRHVHGAWHALPGGARYVPDSRPRPSATTPGYGWRTTRWCSVQAGRSSSAPRPSGRPASSVSARRR